MISLRALLGSTVVSLGLALAPSAKAQVEDDTTYLTEFTTLTKGMASASLVWTLSPQSDAQNRALQALLSAKVNGGTDDITARESIDFRTIHNVDFSVAGTPTHLIFTVQAPQDSFELAIEHANELLRAPSVNANWLKRQNKAFEAISATRVRTPELLEVELTDYALFAGDRPLLPQEVSEAEVFRRPNQIILNAQDYEFGAAGDVLLDGLQSYDAVLNDDAPVPRRALPTGTIHVSDAEATETLVFIGTIQEFETLEQQAQVDTLYKYIGYGPGSEMFRIVRQEKRASYDPRSHFTQIGEKLAFTGLSATVPSKSWPELHGVIKQIYDDTRAGKNTDQGLQNSRNSMLNAMIGDLRRDPNWLVMRYLELYPDHPPKGTIELELINASFEMEPSRLNSQAAKVLPDPSEFLTVIIGGSADPAVDVTAADYCEQPVSEPLAFCLDKLANR